MIVIAILGLLLPGYLLARALRSPITWAIAFPLSAVLLTETVIVFTLTGVPIRFNYVSGVLLLVSLISLAVWLSQGAKPIAVAADTSSYKTPKWLWWVVVAIVSLELLGLAFRTTLYPLHGSDAAIRWEALGRSMLQYESLSYYPPLTADDFAKYPGCPDAIPPLTGTIYWWLYAGWGAPLPPITSILVLLQLSSCLALVFFAANTLFKPPGGLIAVAVLSSATFYQQSIANGQETGYTALCYAGQLAFALAAVREPKASLVVIAGIFGGLGGLAREYGPLLSLCGFAILASQRETRRYLPLFCVVSMGLAAPWYIRNWAITGNPLYPTNLGGGFPVNPVYADIMAKYGEYLGLHSFPISFWPRVVLWLTFGAPLAVLIGIPSLWGAGKMRIALIISVVLAFVIWLWSIPYTGGGFGYSVRVLTPAWIVLSITAGAFGKLLTRLRENGNRFIVPATILGLVVTGGTTVVFCWSFPFVPSDIFHGALVQKRLDPLDSDETLMAICQKLEESHLPAMGMLTDDAYLAVMLARHTRFRPVLVWSPEAAFVFDRRLDVAEVCRRLRANNIRLILYCKGSLNKTYLLQFPLYREDVSKIGLIVMESPDKNIVYLPP